MASLRLPVTSVCVPQCFFFFFNDTATTEIYTLSLHDALPILVVFAASGNLPAASMTYSARKFATLAPSRARSEEHTSELQSRLHLVCRLLLEKKNESCICCVGATCYAWCTNDRVSRVQSPVAF